MALGGLFDQLDGAAVVAKEDEYKGFMGLLGVAGSLCEGLGYLFSVVLMAKNAILMLGVLNCPLKQSTSHYIVLCSFSVD